MDGEVKRMSADIWAIVLINLAGYSQVYFLLPVLPFILPSIGVKPDSSLQAAAAISFAAVAGMTLGPLLINEKRFRLSIRYTVIGLMSLAALILALMAMSADMKTFAIGRFAQAVVMAPVFAILAARLVVRGSGVGIGFMNSARSAGTIIGPMVATTALLWFAPQMVFYLLSLAGFVVVIVVALAGCFSSREPYS